MDTLLNFEVNLSIVIEQEWTMERKQALSLLWGLSASNKTNLKAREGVLGKLFETLSEIVRNSICDLIKRILNFKPIGHMAEVRKDLQQKHLNTN